MVLMFWPLRIFQSPFTKKTCSPPLFFITQPFFANFVLVLVYRSEMPTDNILRGKCEIEKFKYLLIFRALTLKNWRMDFQILSPGHDLIKPTLSSEFDVDLSQQKLFTHSEFTKKNVWRDLKLLRNSHSFSASISVFKIRTDELSTKCFKHASCEFAQYILLKSFLLHNWNKMLFFQEFRQKRRPVKMQAYQLSSNNWIAFSQSLAS